MKLHLLSFTILAGLITVNPTLHAADGFATETIKHTTPVTSESDEPYTTPLLEDLCSFAETLHQRTYSELTKIQLPPPRAVRFSLRQTSTQKTQKSLLPIRDTRKTRAAAELVRQKYSQARCGSSNIPRTNQERRLRLQPQQK